MSAAPFIPAKADWKKLSAASKDCRGCPLYRDATQTVFGEGPVPADIMFIGEVPGDAEDKAGKPFVGPAGRLLDRAMKDAGFERIRVYVTNAVKHFKFLKKGKYRYHRSPGGREMRACRPWLEAEIALVRPKLIVCMGTTAAASVMGRAVVIRDERGLAGERYHARSFITVHPSSILRNEEDREREYKRFVADLKKAKNYAIKNF